MFSQSNGHVSNPNAKFKRRTKQKVFNNIIGSNVAKKGFMLRNESELGNSISTLGSTKSESFRFQLSGLSGPKRQL